jgi:SAM-dependent methyltransferase
MPKDIFSAQATLYAQYRPTYPPALYDFIYSRVGAFGTAWDCATGNGQVAVELAKHFAQIQATDISDKQLDNATPLENIQYSNQPAEHTNFEDDTFDLITVGTALHWFKHDAFYTEAKRVLKPGGVLAAWCYGNSRINSEVDAVFDVFYNQTTAPYWEPERKYVDEGYTTIPFAMGAKEHTIITMQKEWTLQHFAGYLNTWSAVQKMIKQLGYNPVDGFVDELRPLWKDGETKVVTFPIHLLIGKNE